MTTVILFSVYPNKKGNDFISQIRDQINALMQTMGIEFLKLLEMQGNLFEELDNVMELFPFMQDPFKRDELNKELKEVIQQSKTGGLEKFIQEKISHFLNN